MAIRKPCLTRSYQSLGLLTHTSGTSPPGGGGTLSASLCWIGGFGCSETAHSGTAWPWSGGFGFGTRTVLSHVEESITSRNIAYLQAFRI